MARIAKWAFAFALLAVALPHDAAAQDFFTPDQLSEQPSIKSGQQASRAILRSYPRGLRDAGIGGSVQVRFIIDTDGKVDPTSVEIVAASVNALGEAATKALEDIQFTPGKKDGASVRSMVVMPIVYAVS
jgi:periplasmic protein TonB